MIYKHKTYYNTFFILIFVLLSNCQIQETSKNHGILFLDNRFKQLEINKTNKNDTIRIIGNPHTKSVNDKNTWIYIERTLTKGRFHKLGQNVIKKNNVVVLTFNKYGILKEKYFFDKKKLAKIDFTKEVTKNNLSQKSFVQEFLQSVRSKMYGNR